MPFTIPTIYALRAVSVKNISQRLVFINNLYMFKSSLLLMTLGCNIEVNKYTLSHYEYLIT